MDLIRAFLVVAETRNFTQAGLRLGRSQSAISVKIRKLEDIFQCSLLVRNAHDVTLTDEGNKLLSHARSLVRYAEELLADMQKPVLSGKIRIGFLEYVAPQRIPSILAGLQRRLPTADLTFQIGLSSNLMTALNAGEIDLALALHAPERPDSMIVTEDPLVWVESKTHPSKSHDGLINLCLMRDPCVYRTHALNGLKRARQPYIETVTANSILAIRNAVISGIGLSVLGETALGADLQVANMGPNLPPLPQLQLALIGQCENKAMLADAFREILSSS